MNEAYELLGDPAKSPVLIVVDHASRHVPGDIELGIDRAMLTQHIAWDIGAADVARMLVAEYGHAALLGGVSRLVADLNRYPHEAAAIPRASDGIDIPGNRLNEALREERLSRFFHPYHDRLSAILDEHSPKLILSLHSFAPYLQEKPGQLRPWDVGVMYNKDDRGARLALDFLATQSVIVGDQCPYSGEELNATMNRNAEARGIAYTGVELRQDLLSGKVGIKEYAALLNEMLAHIQNHLPV
ncbi:MAG: N-formylglutamate amidohydrolase [Sphingorhabdus sp.]